jgi:amino acid transporter
VLGFTASNCIVFGEYILFAAGKDPADHRGEVRFLAVSLMLAITVVHGCFLRAGILIQNILGWIKLALVGFMVVASAFVVATGYRPAPSGADPNALIPSHFTTFPSWSSIWEGSVWNWGIISTALFKVFYAYAGLQNANNVVNEIVNPVRTLKTAATTALVVSCAVYFLVNVAYFLVVPLEDIKESGELIAALFFERLFGRAGAHGS